MASFFSGAKALRRSPVATQLAGFYRQTSARVGVKDSGTAGVLDRISSSRCIGPRRVVPETRSCTQKRSYTRLEVHNAARPTLDDVDRLSRGKSSKAKIGSRKVPHRLNAEERKGYDLARKRGFVVIPVRSRRYPLINTYRNYCEAVIWPNIRVEQIDSLAQDNVVVDLTTLQLNSAPLLELKSRIESIAQEFLQEKLDTADFQSLLTESESESEPEPVSESESESESSSPDMTVKDSSLPSASEPSILLLSNEGDGDESSEQNSESPTNVASASADEKESGILTFSLHKSSAKSFAKQVFQVCLQRIHSKKALSLG